MTLCLHCDETFEQIDPTHGVKVYCSKRCRHAAHKQRMQRAKPKAGRYTMTGMTPSKWNWMRWPKDQGAWHPPAYPLIRWCGMGHLYVKASGTKTQTRPFCSQRCNGMNQRTHHDRPRQPYPSSKHGLSATQRGYGHAWRMVRLAIFEAEPNCRMCGGHAEELDHVTPKFEGGTDDRSNLQPLCQGCHRSKTLEEANRAQMGGAGVKRDATPTQDRPHLTLGLRAALGA